MPDYLLEVIACSPADARAAEAGGAGRLELCSRLDLAGLTPPAELVKEVAGTARIPVRVRLDFNALDRALRRAPAKWRLTFHRAYDSARGDPESNFELIRRHGRADRILSGNLEAISRLWSRCDSRLEFIVGGGLTAENLPRWMNESGCREFHVGRAARTPEETTAPVDAAKVRRLREVLDAASPFASLKASAARRLPP